jgi:hypothetical protein
MWLAQYVLIWKCSVGHGLVLQYSMRQHTYYISWKGPLNQVVTFWSVTQVGESLAYLILFTCHAFVVAFNLAIKAV